MGAGCLVAERQILLGVGIEIAEGGRQAIAAMLLRNAAERPQRILQALGQRDEALAAEHNMGMLEARECQPEVIEPMRQRDAGNRDAEHARVGEIGQVADKNEVAALTQINYVRRRTLLDLHQCRSAIRSYYKHPKLRR